jgi:hypothetical protein
MRRSGSFAKLQRWGERPYAALTANEPATVHLNGKTASKRTWDISVRGWEPTHEQTTA